MTVAELIEQLKAVDPERLVVLQKDSEGNGHSPLCDFWPGTYIADSTYSGEAFMEKLTLEDRASGYTEEDMRTDGQPAVFFVPVN